MKTIATTLLAAQVYAQTSLGAREICVRNKAAFDLYWYQDDLIINKKGPDSKTYPVDQTKCMPVNVVGANSGDFLNIYIKAVFGAKITADSIVRYQPTPAVTASFTCHGTTLDFSCSLDGFSYAQQLAANGMFAELETFTNETGIQYEPSNFLQ